MSEKIKEQHLQRLAAIYIRQSSPGQVKNNRESYHVQRGLEQRAIQLGWSEDKIRIIEGDLGSSASTPGTRAAFDELLKLVQKRHIGIVLGFDVARLARNNIDWSLLTHWCALHGALLSDQSQVYDPTLPQDSLVLGIQGALAVHELSAIRNRMQSGLDAKASRGELHLGAVPRGYVVVDSRHLRKHPNARVQRVLARVFKQFDTCQSVIQLVDWLWSNEIQLPRSASGDGSQVEWVTPNYQCVLDMLKNPKYAGMYVYPRYKNETRQSADGTSSNVTRRATASEWKIVLGDQHPAYISPEAYQANQEKIAMNAQRYATEHRGSAHAGGSLLSGLITCQRCQHKMQVHYGRSGQVSYSCRNGGRQRERRENGCFRFAAEELERQLGEQILSAISPAGVSASQLVAVRLDSEREAQRRYLTDELEHLHYEAGLARRRFDNVDPENRLVLNTLASELEASMQAVARQEMKLREFDESTPKRPTDVERTRLAELAGCVESVWNDPRSDGSVKKQIVRLLVEHIYADVDESKDEVVLLCKWTGGHHTSLRASRRRAARAKPLVLEAVIDSLRKLYDDESLSRTLNRCGITTTDGASWTKARVQAFRKRHKIDAYSEESKTSSGWLSQHEAATYLEISPMSISRLIEGGKLTVEGNSPLPRVIRREDLDDEEIRSLVKRIKTHPNAPLPINPNQLNLF